MLSLLEGTEQICLSLLSAIRLLCQVTMRSLQLTSGAVDKQPPALAGRHVMCHGSVVLQHLLSLA